MSDDRQRVRDDITRRKLVTGTGAVITTGFVGCLGGEGDSSDDGSDGSTETEEGGQQSDGGSNATEGGGESTEAEAPDQPSMRAEPFESDDATTTLTIQWNGKVFDAVTLPDEEQFWESADDEQYLILQLAIENTGDNPAEFVPGELQITADGTESKWTVLVDGSRLDVTLDPAESVEDWVAFTIPANSEEVVITAEPVGDAYTAKFEFDETLEVPFVPYE
ncbi:DUF4352 domain-containing protein [Halalkalicoccus salilacus]|uniref:DUF4352 domain-containing protein n=1 Tax=Halalkalicoccus salilacus TaxID=3117459 RepID=UPI00300F4F71